METGLRRHGVAGVFCLIVWLFQAGISSSSCPRYCTCSGDVVNCTHMGLTYIPPNIPTTTVHLLLSKNKLSQILSNTFSHLNKLQTLDLSLNRLTTMSLTSRSFVGLQNLRNLSLEGNRQFCNSNNTTFYESFKYLNRLEILDIRYTRMTIKNNNICFMALTYLLNLKCIKMAFMTTFPKEISNLKKLTNATFAVGLDQRQNGFKIYSHTFQPFVSIGMIELNYVKIVKCDKGVFEQLTHLWSLTMRSNPLGRHLTNCTYGLNQTSIKHLDVSLSNLGSFAYDMIPQLYNTNISNLKLDYNSIIIDDEWTKLLKTNIPGIKRLSLVGNTLFTIKPYLDTFQHLPLLKYIYLNNAYFDMAPHKIKDLSIPYIERLVLAYCKRNKASDPLSTYIVKSPHIRYLKAPHAFCLTPVQQILCYVGNELDNLTYVDLSANNISDISHTVVNTCNLTNLQTLQLDDNQLGTMFRKRGNITFFTQLTGIRTLLLSNNDITDIANGTFSSQRHIKKLFLSQNFFTSVPTDIFYLDSLEYVDLRSNKINCLSTSVWKGLDTMYKNNNKLQINFVDNPFYCTCTCFNFIKWILSTNLHFIKKSQYSCTFLDANRTTVSFENSTFILKKLTLECYDNSMSWLITICSIYLILSFSITVITFKYRFRHILYYWWLRLQFTSQRKYLEKKTFECDAFIAYNKDDFQWVRHQLYKVLEETTGEFKFCIHHKDFLGGVAIAENIIQALEKSRHAIFVVSENALKSEWWEFELNMAHQVSLERKRNMIICVFLHEVSPELLPARISRMLKLFTCLRWQAGEIREKQFWVKIKQALTQP